MLSRLQKASSEEIARSAVSVLHKLGVLLRRVSIALTRLPAVAWLPSTDYTYDDDATARQQQHMRIERDKLELQVSLGIGCVHALMDTDEGLRAMLRDGGDVLAYTAALALRTSADATLVMQACQMCFAACVYSHDGYQLVLFILDLLAAARSLDSAHFMSSYSHYGVGANGGSMHQNQPLGPPLPLFDVMDLDPEVVERAGQNGARFETLSSLLRFSLSQDCPWPVVTASALVELNSVLVSDDVCLSRSRRLMYRCEMEKAGLYMAVEELEDRLTERMMKIDKSIELMEPGEHDMSALLTSRATIIDEAFAEEEDSILGDEDSLHVSDEDSEVS
jgi:hypothetical protein